MEDPSLVRMGNPVRRIRPRVLREWIISIIVTGIAVISQKIIKNSPVITMQIAYLLKDRVEHVWLLGHVRFPFVGQLAEVLVQQPFKKSSCKFREMLNLNHQVVLRCIALKIQDRKSTRLNSSHSS